MFHVVLVEPEIPQNAGNIARTCAVTGCVLHLVRPLGFDLSDKYLKRAGLDYWQQAEVRVYDDLPALFAQMGEAPRLFFTTKAERTYTEADYPAGTWMFFGKETAGLDERLLIRNRKDCVRIPMCGESRSLNLSNCVAVAVYEGLRRHDFAGMEKAGRLHRHSWDEKF